MSRLTALNRSMVAITEGNLRAKVPTSGSDEIAEMGRVVEVLRQNTLERNELLVERAHTAERLEMQVDERTAELAHSVEELRALGEVSQAVSSTLDLETVLATIIAKSGAAVGYRCRHNLRLRRSEFRISDTCQFRDGRRVGRSTQTAAH